ncbi:hypothetical protein PR048_030920 [Dryococelus australis]|uniref:Uncharacterized protein n=1 Tax=Dryococelus australis TaxID=614101 RepID=A0ABQ9GA98_9NEOP|nr:hypothetical protein PR048_030920 [Dryococelus australis]
MDLQVASLQRSTTELAPMTEDIYSNILANLNVSLHSASSDTDEATANLEGIGIILTRYDMTDKLKARFVSADETMQEVINVGRRLADEEDKFNNVVEDLCEALDKDSSTAMQQAIAKIEGMGIALAILSSDDLEPDYSARSSQLTAEEIDHLYAKVEKRRYQHSSMRPDLVSHLTPREMRVLKVKKNIAMVFPFYNF